MPAGVGQEDSDLRVLDPPGGASVLTSDPCRMLAFLEEASLVEDQGRLGVVHRLDDISPQVVADLVGVPVGSAEQMLDGVRAPRRPARRVARRSCVAPDRAGQ